MSDSSVPAAQTTSPAPAAPKKHSHSHDALQAFQNAFKLGGSLVFTIFIGFGVQMLLPRLLGPEAFGYMNFADAFTLTSFIMLSLGIETWLRKEVPVRPEVANGVFGGLLVLRVGVAAVLIGALTLVMVLTHRPPIVILLVFLFGLGQTCLQGVSMTLSAILQARGEVDALSVLNGVTKVLWAAVILGGLAIRHGLVAVPIAFALSEAVKAVVLYVVAYRHVGLRFVVDLRATWAALKASLPFYANIIAFTAYGRIDITVLAFVIADPLEQGWYSAASRLANLCLLVAPVIGWVLLPLFAKAAARDPEELRRTLARSMEAVLGCSIFISLFVALGADVMVRIFCGPAFAPSAGMLRILATMIVATYVAMVSATCLNVLGRGWLVTSVSTAGLLMNPFMNVFLIRLTRAHVGGPGSAGLGAALAMMTSEILVTVGMTLALGGMAFDRRSARVLSRTGVAVALVVALHVALRPLGPARLLLDLAAYLGLLLALRAVHWHEVVEVVRSTRAHRGQATLA